MHAYFASGAMEVARFAASGTPGVLVLACAAFLTHDGTLAGLELPSWTLVTAGARPIFLVLPSTARNTAGGSLSTLVLARLARFARCGVAICCLETPSCALRALAICGSRMRHRLMLARTTHCNRRAHAVVRWARGLGLELVLRVALRSNGGAHAIMRDVARQTLNSEIFVYGADQRLVFRDLNPIVAGLSCFIQVLGRLITVSSYKPKK